MQITLPIPTALLLLSLPFQTFSTPTPEIQATSNGPLTIPPLSLGAATVNIGGTSRIYWQALDGGVHEALGNGSPGPGRTYVDQILIPSGKARIGTPLSIVDGTNGLIIRLFYISTEDRLKEYYYDRTAWRDGPLNAQNVTTRSASRYLWAVNSGGPGQNQNQNQGKVRVGFVSPNGDLSEVAFDGDAWNKYVY